ncbi:MAG: hypothetical protein JKX73_01505, partial [Flavobacteriales bacterium]|nr:hypothetical protein [Flavobacteriales bacterium]
MKVSIFTFFLGFLFASFSVLGQAPASATLQTDKREKCGTMENHARRLAADPTLEAKMQAQEFDIQNWIAANPVASSTSASGKKIGTVVTIPVVVHVVYANATENVPDEQIFSQIEVLNEDFRRLNADTGDTPDVWKGIAADFEVEFCLAVRDPDGNPTTGITRTSTTETSFSTNDDVKFDATGGKDSWNTSEYLNIWVCDISGSTIGYAEFPSGGFSNTWGIVITYWGFGKGGVTSAPYDVGRTGVHEVGHCFNLRHIWGDDGNLCVGSDNVADTPDQEGSTGGCPTHPALDNCSP